MSLTLQQQKILQILSKGSMKARLLKNRVKAESLDQLVNDLYVLIKLNLIEAFTDEETLHGVPVKVCHYSLTRDANVNS